MNLIIAGPNLDDQQKGDFHVHQESCGDLGRPEYRTALRVPIDADTRAQVVDCIYADFDAAQDYSAEVWFAPCCQQLPAI